MKRALAGEFGCCLKDENVAQSNQPLGTRSMMIAYTNSRGHRIFIVHFFLLPGHTVANPKIGASGREDPKWLFENGVVYEIDPGLKN